jgi:hypothetical protein
MAEWKDGPNATRRVFGATTDRNEGRSLTMTLLQKLIAMQSQLSEATIEGELDQFIDDQHEDLHRLLDQAIRVLGSESK